MDDEYLYATDAKGRRFRATVFESKYVPLGYCRYCVEVFSAAVDYWFTVEDNREAWLWPDAEIHCKDRLQWWSENYDDSRIAKVIG